MIGGIVLIRVIYQLTYNEVPMDKKELKTKLEVIQHNYQLGILSIGLLQHGKVRKIMSYVTPIIFDKYKFNAKKIINIHETTPRARKTLHRNFFLMTMSSALTNLYENVRTYCESTNQLEKFKKQPYYDVLRLLRNSFSCNYKMHYSNYDKTILPLVWNEIELTHDMEGESIEYDNISITQYTYLINKVGEFVSSLD